ncbi:EAL domain-containing protein [Pseudidiomarina homiensis]|uniref:EAL domain-containing protein n=1 Tax=Pseudidiomarina homiensis TaxID=364198 RepID=UPI00215A70E6|nr:EAL domain-containing protein [Pseudidiomarina homiensis]
MNTPKAHILVVEDSPTQAAELCYLLESNGCDVSMARNGMEALSFLENNRPTLIISDIVMPEMDGYQLCRQIKHNEALNDIPIILVTALADPGDVIRGLTCGADNFIVKPYSEKYLLSRIQYFLINSELRSHERMQLGFEVLLNGERHFITSSRQQILDLLISTYEQGVRLNSELREKHDELARSNNLLAHLHQFSSRLSSAQTIEDVTSHALQALASFPSIAKAWVELQDPNKPSEFKVSQSAGDQQASATHAAKIPLSVDGEPIGYLLIAPRQQGPWGSESMEAFQSIARQFALALARARLFEGLEDLVEQRTKDLYDSQAILRTRSRAIEASSNAVIITDNTHEQPMVYVNPAFERITGYSSEEVLGKNCRMLQGPETNNEDLDKIRRAIENREEGTAVLLNYRKDGSPFWNELTVAPVENDSGEVSHFIGIMRDITESKKYREELERQANYDSLTELPNRNLLSDRLQQTIAYAEEDNETFAIAYFDIDNFKVINDSLGHEHGDELLRVIANRLRHFIQATDTAARVGGDDFFVILTNNDIDGYISRINQLRAELAKPIHVAGQSIEVTFSVGISVFPDDGEEPSMLQRNVDNAMYQAKRNGRNQMCLFRPSMNTEVQRRLQLEQSMRAGLRNKEFLAFLQPQRSLHTGELVGLEALVRWQQNGELIPPDEFIPLAEQNGLIVDIDFVVLAKACAFIPTLRKYSKQASIAINISAITFMTEGFINRFFNCLEEHNVDPSAIKIELTETILIGNADVALEKMETMKQRGTSFAIDDFGTGYSSLGYLKRFPFAQMKVDKSFIHDVHEDPDSGALVRSMISMAHNLGINVIAEGVEHQEHIDFLRHAGCDEIQGYILSKPLALADVTTLLAEWAKPDQAMIHTEEAELIYIATNDSDCSAQVEEYLTQLSYQTQRLETAPALFSQLKSTLPNAILLDVALIDDEPLEWLRQIRTLDNDVVIIACSVEENSRSTLEEAFQQRLIDRFTNHSCDANEIGAIVDTALYYSRLRQENNQLRRLLRDTQ